AGTGQRPSQCWPRLTGPAWLVPVGLGDRGVTFPYHLPVPSLWGQLIRAKAVSAKEVDSGNDIYGNPIKRIQYEIKQIKMFKGPDKDIEFIYTAPSTAVCGRLLDTGGKKEYLIAGGWLQGRALGGCRWQCWPCCLACLPRCLRHVCRLPGHGFPPRPPSPTTSPRGTPWLRPGCAR
uniref:TIMP metallopeptidase inhibitor 2 n=1 Tax=Accipiter nisus TaxID=211598 RepID=A0A8B9M3I5_9AVES